MMNHIELILLAVFMVMDIVFIFKRTRNNEINRDDDINTPGIIENRYGDYCEECGNTIEAKHTYCDNCGKKVR